MVILTIVASFLACLVLFAGAFTMVGLHRRKLQAGGSGAGRPDKRPKRSS